MKITKARLKQIIKEELQSEIVIGTYFAGKAANKAKKQTKKRSSRYMDEDLLAAYEDFKRKADRDPTFLEKAMNYLKKMADLEEADVRVIKYDCDDDDGDGEGKMADSQLNRIADLATMIDEMVDDDTNLPEWVESKITKAQDYMSAVMNYMKGKKADAEEEMIDEET